MEQNIEFKGFEPGTRLRNLLASQSAHLERKCKNFSPDAIFLRIVVEAFQVHKRYRTSITLDVPGKTLAASEQAPEAEAAVRETFAEIEKQLASHKSALRGERWRNQAGQRKVAGLVETAEAGGTSEATGTAEAPEIAETPETPEDAETAEDEARAEFFARMRPYMEWFNRFVRHALAYAVSRGDIPRNHLSAEDLAGETLLRGFHEFNTSPPLGAIRSWLKCLVFKELGSHVGRDRVAEAREPVRVESDVPETPPSEEVTQLGEEIMYFYQPDEDLRTEDVLPDIRVKTPEHQAEETELRDILSSALRAMPAELRHVIYLRYYLELTGPDLYREMKKDKSEVDRLLKEARADLQRRLAEAGVEIEAAEETETSPATAWELFQKQRT